MGNLLVYKASAGSGKTYQLALEYIKLAVQNPSPNSYRHILAVTFTNKATAEMKERILLHLYNLAQGGTDEGFLKNLLEKLNAKDEGEEKLAKPYTKDLVCQRAKQTLQAIIHDYDHFRVETIDSFFQSLLTNLAHELNLPRTFRVDLNDKEVIVHAVNRLIAELNDSKSKSSKAGAAGFVMDYMDESIDNEQGWNMVQALCEFANLNMRNETYLHHEEELTAALNDKKGIDHLREETARFDKLLGDKMKVSAQRAVDLMEDMPGGPTQFSFGGTIIAYPKKILAGEFLTEPSNRVKTAIKDASKLVKTADQKKPDMMGAAYTLSGLLDSIREAQKEYGKIVTTGHITLSQLRPMRLLRLIEDNAKDINEEANRFMLSKTPELFSRIVKADDASFVFERVGTTFNHIMIDEFQDTSRMQWNNFHKLLVENMAQGNQCMLVGDTKQSIYRWRGGDWAILEGVEKDSAFQKCKSIPLNINYRSKEEIVKFNNAFFPVAAKDLDALAMDVETLDREWHERISGIYKEELVKQNLKDNAEGGWVRLALAPAGKDCIGDIYEDVYAQIVLLHNHAHVAYHDIGILVRKNAEGAQLIEYFSSTHPDIPINSDEAYKLSASPAVMKLVYALRYIADPDNLETRLHFLTALGITSRMEDGTDSYEIAATFPHTFADPTEELPEILREEDSLKKLRSMPLYELCQQLIMELKLTPEKNEDDGQSAYLFYFLDAVLDFLEDNPSDLPLFLEFWDTTLSSKSTTGSTGDSVYVMTVHKSKGLARHTILIPFCDWEISKFHKNDMLWSETPDQEPFNTLPVTAVKPNEKGIDLSFYSHTKQCELVQQRIDNLNTLYVAFTRAKQNLLVWSRTLPKDPKKDKGEIKHVGSLLYKHASDFLHKANEQPMELRLSDEELDGTTFPQALDREASEAEEVETDNDFSVYTSGELRIETSAEECQEAAVSKEKKNPLDNPVITPITLNLNPQPRAQIEFRQSNPAKDFIAEAESLTAAQLAEATEDAAEFASTQDDLQRAYIDRGKILHRVLSEIRTLDDLPHVLQQLKVEGVLSSQKEAERMAALIEKRVKSQAEWFDGSWDLYNERDIIYRDENGKLCTARPDRVMKKGTDIVIVDFKFGKPNPEKYREQVQKYGSLVHGLSQGSIIKEYIWYVLQDKVEYVSRGC